MMVMIDLFNTLGPIICISDWFYGKIETKSGMGIRAFVRFKKLLLNSFPEGGNTMSDNLMKPAYCPSCGAPVDGVKPGEIHKCASCGQTS